MQPVDGSSEYTLRPALPANNLPPATAGCAYDTTSPGNPNAHLSLSLAMSAALKPAISAFWNRLLARSTPHPFQCGPRKGSVKAAAPGLQNASEGGAVALSRPSRFPDRNSANARRPPADRNEPSSTIHPV